MTGRLVRLGALPVWSASFQPLELRRDARPTRRTGADRYRFALLLEGEAVITCGRRETHLRAGEFHCDDGLRPHEIRTGPIRAVGALIPEALLPLPRDSAHRVLGHRIPGQDGMAPLLARFPTQIVEHTGAYRPAEGPRLGAVLSSLVAALLARTTEPVPCPHRHPGRR